MEAGKRTLATFQLEGVLSAQCVRIATFSGDLASLFSIVHGGVSARRSERVLVMFARYLLVFTLSSVLC